MSRYHITESVTVYLDDFNEKDIEKYMESKGYEFVDNEVPDETEAESLIGELQNHSDYLYQEKENIRIFFAQDKFRYIPNKDLVEFLNKY